jgi:hypothetical protein
MWYLWEISNETEVALVACCHQGPTKIIKADIIMHVITTIDNKVVCSCKHTINAVNSREAIRIAEVHAVNVVLEDRVMLSMVLDSGRGLQFTIDAE